MSEIKPWCLGTTHGNCAGNSVLDQDLQRAGQAFGTG